MAPPEILKCFNPKGHGLFLSPFKITALNMARKPQNKKPWLQCFKGILNVSAAILISIRQMRMKKGNGSFTLKKTSPTCLLTKAKGSIPSLRAGVFHLGYDLKEKFPSSSVLSLYVLIFTQKTSEFQ